MIGTRNGSEMVELKNGDRKLKNTFTIFDESGASVDLIIWGNHWPGFCYLVPGRIVALRGVVVGDYRGKNLSSSWGLSIDIDTPKSLPRYVALTEFCRNRTTETMMPINRGPFSTIFQRDRRKIWSIEEIEYDSSQTFNGLRVEQMTTTPLFYNTVAYIGFIQSNNMCYNACPNPKCIKKVYLEGDQWHCYKCETSYVTCERRLVVNIKIKDHTGDIWVMPSNQV
jgi:replication factor A1